MLDKSPTLKGERTQLKIMEAAYGLFLEQGYHGTSMRQIAKRAGIALGGIYNHFPGKEAIFATVLDQYHPYHQLIPILVAAPGESFSEFLHSAARLMAKAVEDRPEFLNLMFIEFVEFNGRHLPGLYNAAVPQLVEIIERFSRAKDRLRPIPIPILMRAFLGLFFAYVLAERFLEPEATKFPLGFQENALEHMVDIYLNGVLV